MRAWIALLWVAGVTVGPLRMLAGAEPAPQQMAAADVERWLTFWDKLVITVAQSQVTCDKVAIDVSSLAERNRSAIAVAKTARTQGKKLPKAAQQHMLDGVKQMVPVMRRCGQHAKVRAAFAWLDLTRK